LLYPGQAEMSISHESIYQSIYVYPRGGLKRELRACLRSGRMIRRRRRGRPGTRGQIIGAVPIGEGLSSLVCK
jgi:IS30 family transposase